MVACSLQVSIASWIVVKVTSPFFPTNITSYPFVSTLFCCTQPLKYVRIHESMIIEQIIFDFIIFHLLQMKDSGIINCFEGKKSLSHN